MKKTLPTLPALNTFRKWRKISLTGLAFFATLPFWAVLSCAGGTLLETSFDSLPTTSISAAELNDATHRGTWTLNTDRGATFSIEDDGYRKALLMDDNTGDNRATIKFASIALESPENFEADAVVWKFRTATRRTGVGKALRYDFFAENSIIASIEWSNDGSLSLNTVSENSDFTFLFPWNSQSGAVRDVTVTFLGSMVGVNFNGVSLVTGISDDVSSVQGMRVYSSGTNQPNSHGRGVFIDDITVNHIPESTIIMSHAQLRDFRYNPSDGSAEVTIEGAPMTLYKLVATTDLDFVNPDQNPLPLTGSTVGALFGDTVRTDGKSTATVQFNFGTDPSNFIRAQTLGPVTIEREILVDVHDVLSDVERKPGGFVSSWLLDSDIHRPRSVSMVDVYKQLGVQSLRFPFGHLSNNYLWTTPPYNQAIRGLTPRVATMERAPGQWEWAVNPDGTFRQDLDFDEFVEQCREAGVEPIVVINVMSHKYPDGPSLDELREAAVEWVRYANITRDYNVKYWQLGNEQDHHSNLMSLEEYTTIYGDFTEAMREVDPTIRTGLAVIRNRGWTRTIIEAFPERVDFVGSHQYQWNDWNVSDWRDLTMPLITNVIGIQTEVQNSPRPDAEIMITEFSSRGSWFDGSGELDMMRTLCLAEMLLHLATLENVVYAHFWTTHSPWQGEDSDGGLASALTQDNEIKPTAEVIGIVNNSLGNKMIRADRISGLVRTFASYAEEEGRVILYLINKGDSPVVARLRLNDFTPQRVVTRLVYSGESYDDLRPTKTMDNNASLENNQVTTLLPGVSLIVLTIE